MTRLERAWYAGSRWPYLLLPLSLLFALLSGLRRGLYRRGLLRSYQLPVPVIIIGNISVGGSGKTPLVIATAELLQQAGYRPGIISRGYGGRAGQWPQRVSADSDPQQIGDEPLLIARRTGLPVVVGPDRVAAAEALLAEGGVDLLLCDDGLQHYRLRRDIEVAVIDGQRRLGNGLLLPAGPLREGARRLKRVDLVVANGKALAGELAMALTGSTLTNLVTGERLSLDHFAGQRVDAVAGIGNPARFFATLRQAGIDVEPHPFADHHPFTASDLEPFDRRPLLMTEKDAVKCRSFANMHHWYLPVVAQLPDSYGQRLTARLQEVIHNG